MTRLWIVQLRGLGYFGVRSHHEQFLKHLCVAVLNGNEERRQRVSAFCVFRYRVKQLLVSAAVRESHDLVDVSVLHCLNIVVNDLVVHIINGEIITLSEWTCDGTCDGTCGTR